MKVQIPSILLKVKTMKPMTIRLAKEICKQEHGRLPRMGYESCVTSFYRYYLDDDSPVFTGWRLVEVWLQNHGGRYRIWESVDVNPMRDFYRYSPKMGN